MRVDIFASESIRLSTRQLSRPYDLRGLDELKAPQGRPKPSVVVGPARELALIHPRFVEALAERGVRVIVTEAVPGSPMPRFSRAYLHCTLPHLEEHDEWRILSAFLNNAIDILMLQERTRRTEQDLEEITKIGVLLSSEKDTTKLLEMILTKSREVTDCDAGSLYLIEESDGRRQLLFKLAQNESIPLNLREVPIPLNTQSLAGYVVLKGEPLVIDNAYDIDPNEPYSHARWMDKQNRYRTITMLTVPLKNLKGEVVGALQLINRKRDRRILLTDAYTAMVNVMPFDEHSIQVVSSLASLAAVTLEKNRLYEAIQNLFEGFVRASVKAIESRDPTTSGHSERVALLTVGLAERVDLSGRGPFAAVTFSKEELLELRYASLLHDFGKVGVREHVLVKANKLYPGQADVLRMRVQFIRAAIQAAAWKRRWEAMEAHGSAGYAGLRERLEEEAHQAAARLEDDLAFVWEANIPKVLAGGGFERLQDIAERVYTVFNDEPLKLITPEEARVLSIPRGSLTEEERLEIESHVTHTFNFLHQIPWTKELKRVPEIAYKHHEKLNRRGYPRRLVGPEIPIQTRMMTICDIFDALTASDRPYKKAVSFEKAFDILAAETKEGMLDAQLLDIFIEAKVYDQVRAATV